MTTYTVTITSDGSNETYREVTPATLKMMKSNNAKGSVKATKNEAPKFWYYRGTMVALVEEMQNGYTLVNAADGSFYARFANTVELEYR